MKTQKTYSSKQETWFDNLVSTLRSHELQLETGTAPDEVRSFYENLFSGNIEQMMQSNKEQAQKYFVPQIIGEYLQILGNQHPQKLAFDFNDSEVLVWAQVEDDDYETEKRLFLAEAKVNAKFHDKGFDMRSTIVEASDKLPIPQHYRPYIK